MSYEHRSNVRNNNVPSIVKALSLIVLFIFIIYFLFPNFLPKILYTIISPFWSSKNILTDEENVISLDLHNATISELQRENEDLKNILHRNASSSPMILAHIVKKPPFTAYDSYIVDIGKNNVQIGYKVYALGNVLIGEVSEVIGSFAKVKLYSSYGEKFTALIGKNNIQANVTGNGGGTFESILPKDVKISLGDVVTVPDINNSVFGIVRDISVDPARAFTTVLFSQPVNIYEQKWVQIYNLTQVNEKRIK